MSGKADEFVEKCQGEIEAMSQSLKEEGKSGEMLPEIENRQGGVKDLIQGHPDEQIEITVPLHLVLSPRHASGRFPVNFTTAAVKDDDGGLLGTIGYGFGTLSFEKEGTGELWVLRPEGLWDGFEKAMKNRKDPA